MGQVIRVSTFLPFTDVPDGWLLIATMCAVYCEWLDPALKSEFKAMIHFSLRLSSQSYLARNGSLCKGVHNPDPWLTAPESAMQPITRPSYALTCRRLQRLLCISAHLH